jgi:hypothetical protein
VTPNSARPKFRSKLLNFRANSWLWYENLPEELSFDGGCADTDPRPKVELKMYFHSVDVFLSRHCLCEIRIENDSDRSREFNRSSARACIYAAMSMSKMLPDYPSAHEAYQLLPWWMLLHLMAQATSVLLLELALNSQHLPNEAPQLISHLRKALG